MSASRRILRSRVGKFYDSGIIEFKIPVQEPEPDATVGVVGALGTTGRAVAVALAQQGVRLRLLGRREDALTELTADFANAHARAVDVTDRSALLDALEGVGVVVSCVGPYSELGLQVAQAALTVGAHYVDVSGEPEWVLQLREKIDIRARAQSQVLVPACGASAVLGDVAARFAVADVTGPVRSVDIVYRVSGLQPSPATAASYAHIFAGRAIHFRKTQPCPRAVGATRRVFPDGSAFDLPVCDPLVISRWLESAEVSGYVAAPAAGVTRHLARASSVMLRRQLARRLLQFGYRRLASGDGRSGTLTVDAIATTPTDRTAFRSVAPDLYFTTSAAAAAVASRLSDGSNRAGGLTAPTQVLGELNDGVLAGLGISCTRVHLDNRIPS